MTWDQVVAWLIVLAVGCPVAPYVVTGTRNRPAVIAASPRRLLLAKVFSNGGITLTVLAVYLVLGAGTAFRWLLAAELVLVGGLCVGVAQGLMLRSSTT